MGKRGPAPVPNAIKKARGSWRGNTNKQEPEVKEPLAIPPPVWLVNPDAVECWNRLRPLLGWMKATDTNIFARYCETWGVYRQRCGERALPGADHESLDPRVAKLAELLLRMEAQIGLTPSARSGIRVDEKPKNNRKIELLQGGKRASGSNA